MFDLGLWQVQGAKKPLALDAVFVLRLDLPNIVLAFVQIVIFFLENWCLFLARSFSKGMPSSCEEA